MTCSEYRDHVEDLLDELLPPEDAERYEVHRASCAECGAHAEEAERFRRLLVSEGRAALGAWEARRLALRAASLSHAEPVSPAPVQPRRFGVLTLAAAAAVVAAAGIFGAGVLGAAGPVQLALGEEARLSPGTVATFGHDCSLVVEDRAVTVELQSAADGSGDVVRMERGVALFRAHPEHALAIATVQGTARAVGATFVVDVRSDGAVSVDVVTGRVRLERRGGLVVARPGERVEVDSRGAAHIVSRGRIEELEQIETHSQDQIEQLRDELQRAEEQLDAYAAAAQSGDAIALPTDELPFHELGRAMRVLTDPKVGWRDPRRNEAMAFFLLNAERIRVEFGASDPIRASQNPGFMAAVAPGFLAAMAPDAPASSIAAAAAVVRDVCARVEAVMAGEPLPTELVTSRQRALIEIIRGVEQHLGVAAAVEIVGSMRGEWDGPQPSVSHIDDRLEAGIVGFRQKTLDLDDEQTNQFAAMVREYVAQCVVMQERVAAALPADEVESVVYPARKWPRGGFGWGERPGRDATRGNGDGAPETTAEPVVVLSQSEIVTARLRELDARLHLAEPRIRYERALWNLLTPEQRAKAFRGGAQLFTYREQSAPASGNK